MSSYHDCGMHGSVFASAGVNEDQEVLTPTEPQHNDVQFCSMTVVAKLNLKWRHWRETKTSHGAQFTNVVVLMCA